MALTVVHVLASTRADHGGTSRSVPALCEALDAEGVEVHLVTAVPADPGPDQVPILPGGGVQVHRIEERTRLQRTLRSPFGFHRRLQSVVGRVAPDVIHDHGAWLPSNVLAAWTARSAGVPLVGTPRGMFTDWSLAHRAAKKRLAWYAYQRWTMRQAACFHVTAEAETEALRALGLPQPTALIPNGVPLPEAVPDGAATPNRRALFLSRVHPKKGLPMLLDAWARVAPDGWTLEIVGPDENGHRAELEAQAAELNLDDTVVFSGPVDDADKWTKYATADLFVLPTHSENFGIVVAEALAASVPALTTTGAPWSVLEEENCGWWVEPTVASLEAALSDAVGRTDDERLMMGRRGRALVEEQFSWPSVGAKMKATYRWLLDDGPRPDVVRSADE